jgi:MATE family multidrug resistance protein
MTLYQSINTFFFMFPMGCSVAGATRVGKALGAGDARAASMSATVSVSTAALLSFGMGSFLYFAPHTMLPSLFTREPDVVHQASQLITLLAFYVFADGVQAALNGIIRGCGRQCVIMPVVVVAYWVVGLPLSYYWAFMRHDGYMCDDSPTCGVNGLVMGMTIGTWTHMLLMLLLVVATTDWEIQSERAIQRLAQDDTTINDTKPTTLQIKEQSAIKPTIESSTVCVIQL